MYLSGMIPEDTSQDITGQVKQALAEIDSLLAKGGSDKTKILSAADLARRHRRLRRHERRVGRLGGAWPRPARATVEAKLNDPKMKIEIMVVAAI